MAVAQPIPIRFERYDGALGIAPAAVPRVVTPEEKPALLERARRLLKERDAVLVAHYYVHPDIQDLAESTGGVVSDSLEMARFGHNHPAQTVVVSGVRFMGETAKILNPEKRVYNAQQMPMTEAAIDGGPDLFHGDLAGSIVELCLHIGEAIDARDDLGGILAQAV